MAQPIEGVSDRTPALLPPLFGSNNRRLAEEEEASRNQFLRNALQEEKLQGHKIATVSRTVALLIVAAMLPLINPNWDVLYYQALIMVFIGLGWLQLRVATVGQSRIELALIFFDLVFLAVVLLAPNPFVEEDWPTAVHFRFENFKYFYLLLAASTLAYSWRTVMSFGTWVPLVWLSGMGLVLVFGKQVPHLSEAVASALAGYDRIIPLFDPNNLQVMSRIQEVVLFFIVAIILGLKSWRSNQLLQRQARIAAERANLSRYFPPTMVDDLALRDEPLGPVRSQDVAVLFADIVGFTRLAETRTPDEVVALLRRFHAILEVQVFAHDGTLDKYLGDGIMATFGTPRASERDAANALLAAQAMQEAVREWNDERRQAKEPPIELSIGINYGPVILGDIGSERRLEFAALGDTVNVASRLEHATRELKCKTVVSRSLIDKIDSETKKTPLLAGLSDRHSLEIRGRDSSVDVYVL